MNLHCMGQASSACSLGRIHTFVSYKILLVTRIQPLNRIFISFFRSLFHPKFSGMKAQSLRRLLPLSSGDLQTNCAGLRSFADFAGNAPAPVALGFGRTFAFSRKSGTYIQCCPTPYDHFLPVTVMMNISHATARNPRRRFLFSRPKISSTLHPKISARATSRAASYCFLRGFPI